MKLNFSDHNKSQYVHTDVKKFLADAGHQKFHLIIMDPPSFSNSKRMDDFLDVQRDHVEMINQCMNLLHDSGILYFSTNLRNFKLNASGLNASEIKDITRLTTPFDFTGKLHRYCFRICK
jgi:23S rRNA (cytosine1962-C5)-methyltransferase